MNFYQQFGRFRLNLKLVLHLKKSVYLNVYAYLIWNIAKLQNIKLSKSLKQVSENYIFEFFQRQKSEHEKLKLKLLDNLTLAET